MKTVVLKSNELVDLIDELNICGCGEPNKVYKKIHMTMLRAKGRTLFLNSHDYDNELYIYMVHQLNHQGFLDHGSSIYGSFITKKGERLLKALKEFSKYDYDYQEFNDNNLIEVEE